MRHRTMAIAQPNTSAPAVPCAAPPRPEVASYPRAWSCSQYLRRSAGTPPEYRVAGPLGGFFRSIGDHLALHKRRLHKLFSDHLRWVARPRRNDGVGYSRDLVAGSAGLAVGSAYLTVATGVDHLVDEFGVARQDAPVDRSGGGDDLAVAAQYRVAEFQDQQVGPGARPDRGDRVERRAGRPFGIGLHQD